MPSDKSILATGASVVGGTVATAAVATTAVAAAPVVIAGTAITTCTSGLVYLASEFFVSGKQAADAGTKAAQDAQKAAETTLASALETLEWVKFVVKVIAFVVIVCGCSYLYVGKIPTIADGSEKLFWCVCLSIMGLLGLFFAVDIMLSFFRSSKNKSY